MLMLIMTITIINYVSLLT